MQDARRSHWIIFQHIQTIQHFVFMMMTSIASQSGFSIEEACGCEIGAMFGFEFRMLQGTFQYICIELKPIIEKKDSAMRQAIPLEQATNSEYHTIAHLFGVSRLSVCVIV